MTLTFPAVDVPAGLGGANGNFRARISVNPDISRMCHYPHLIILLPRTSIQDRGPKNGERDEKGERDEIEYRGEGDIPISINNPSTPSPLFALASANKRSSSLANSSPNSLDVFREEERSDLLPTSIIIVEGSTCLFSSLTQVFAFSNDA